MKRITTMLMCLLCTLMIFGEKHLMFRTLPIDGELKTAVKEVKKWGFMGMKLKNVAAMMGTLDGEEVILTLMATPESKTLFSVAVLYEGADKWEEVLAQYNAVNAPLVAQYGEPTDLISEWEAPYSLENNPLQAIKDGKAKYGSAYTAESGTITVNLISTDGKMCILVAYIDKQNGILYKTEGGTEVLFNENEEGDIIE